MLNEGTVTFSISATQLNALDSTKQTLVTFADDGVIRVPRRLELRRNAGTAYSITLGNRPKSKARDGDYFDTAAEGHQGGANLFVEVTSQNDSFHRMWFDVDTEGFLDVATEQSRVVLPRTESRVYKDGAKDVKLGIKSSIASGTGSLEGTLFFDEYRLTMPMAR